jgi:hypothetical protein
MVFTYAPLAIILGEVAIFAVFIYWFRLSSLNKRWSLPLAGIGLGLTIAAEPLPLFVQDYVSWLTLVQHGLGFLVCNPRA